MILALWEGISGKSDMSYVSQQNGPGSVYGKGSLANQWCWICVGGVYVWVACSSIWWERIHPPQRGDNEPAKCSHVYLHLHCLEVPQSQLPTLSTRVVSGQTGCKGHGGWTGRQVGDPANVNITLGHESCYQTFLFPYCCCSLLYQHCTVKALFRKTDWKYQHLLALSV